MAVLKRAFFLAAPAVVLLLATSMPARPLAVDTDSPGEATLLRIDASSPPEAYASHDPMLLRTVESKELLAAARRDLFAYRMHAAEGRLRQLALLPDGRPAATFHLVAVALHRALASDAEADFETFDASVDSMRAVLDGLESSVWRDYLAAELDLYRAVGAGKRNRNVRAALAARSAFGSYRRLVDAYPDFYEPYKGLGVLRLAIGSLPSTYRFLLRILGYSGSIAGGLDDLEVAYHRSTYNREEAGLCLALTHTLLYLSKEEALRTVRRLYEEQPESTLLAHVYAFVLLSVRRAADAEHVLRPVAERSGDGEYVFIDYVDFYLAEAIFRQDRFDEAEHFYRRFLDRHEGPALKALAYLGLGYSVEMQGRREEAVRYFRAVRVARDFDTDAAARRAADRLVAAPMSASVKQLLSSRNAYDSGRYAEAAAGVTRVMTDAGVGVAERAEAAYRLGRVYHATERFDEAIAWYERGVQLRGEASSRWAPWGRFFVAKIHHDHGRLDEARVAYREALSFRGNYDYQQSLEQSARAGLEMLDRERGNGAD